MTQPKKEEETERIRHKAESLMTEMDPTEKEKFPHSWKKKLFHHLDVDIHPHLKWDEAKWKKGRKWKRLKSEA